MTQLTAGIIIIGNEILSGRTLDTNKNFMCKELTLKGIDVIEARVIKDDIKKIITVVNEVRKIGNDNELMVVISAFFTSLSFLISLKNLDNICTPSEFAIVRSTIGIEVLIIVK